MGTFTFDTGHSTDNTSAPLLKLKFEDYYLLLWHLYFYFHHWIPNVFRCKRFMLNGLDNLLENVNYWQDSPTLRTRFALHLHIYFFWAINTNWIMPDNHRRWIHEDRLFLLTLTFSNKLEWTLDPNSIIYLHCKNLFIQSIYHTYCTKYIHVLHQVVA